MVYRVVTGPIQVLVRSPPSITYLVERCCTESPAGGTREWGTRIPGKHFRRGHGNIALGGLYRGRLAPSLITGASTVSHSRRENRQIQAKNGIAMERKAATFRRTIRACMLLIVVAALLSACATYFVRLNSRSGSYKRRALLFKNLSAKEFGDYRKLAAEAAAIRPLLGQRADATSNREPMTELAKAKREFNIEINKLYYSMINHSLDVKARFDRLAQLTYKYEYAAKHPWIWISVEEQESDLLEGRGETEK
jgi:hypothetical protein